MARILLVLCVFSVALHSLPTTTHAYYVNARDAEEGNQRVTTNYDYQTTPVSQNADDDDDEELSQATLQTPIAAAANRPVMRQPLGGDLFGLCRDCVVNHGVGFAPNPGQCKSYIQCKFYGDMPTQGSVMHCPGNLYWNQYKLTCDWPENVKCVEIDQCPNQRELPGQVTTYEQFYGNGWQRVTCPQGFGYNDQTCACSNPIQVNKCPNQRPIAGDATTYEQLYGTRWNLVKCLEGYSYNNQACDCSNPIQARCKGLKPINGDPKAFLQLTVSGWVRMPCPVTLVYDATVCTCIRDFIEEISPRKIAVKKSCRPHLQMLFDNSTRDSSDFKFWVNNTNVVVKNGYAVFDGHSKLIIPGLSNVDFGQTLYVRMRYQQERANALQTLLANGDCEIQPYIAICSNSTLVQASMTTSAQSGVSPVALGVPQNIYSSQWEDIFLTLDQNVAELRTLSGNRRDALSVEGAILRRPRGLVIGGGGACENFTGLIDKVEVFICRPDIWT